MFILLSLSHAKDLHGDEYQGIVGVNINTHAHTDKWGKTAVLCVFVLLI